jgi:hypothetical protein
VYVVYSTFSIELYIFLHISLSLITISSAHRTLQPCSSNQCDTARLESKLTRRSNHVHLTSHEIEHSFSYDYEAQRFVYRRLRRRTKRRLRDTRSVPGTTFFPGTLLRSQPPLISLTFSQLSKQHILELITFLLLLHIFAQQ